MIGRIIKTKNEYKRVELTKEEVMEAIDGLIELNVSIWKMINEELILNYKITGEEGDDLSNQLADKCMIQAYTILQDALNKKIDKIKNK